MTAPLGGVPEAIRAFNLSKARKIGLFHATCRAGGPATVSARFALEVMDSEYPE